MSFIPSMYRLLNDVVKPWDQLNGILSQPFALQPDLSDVTRMATSLAIAIKHQADLRNAKRGVVDRESFENRVMSDVADSAKHGDLRDSTRNNKLSVASCFEYANGRGFRFMRNSVTIEHARLGELDFMATSLAATQYWMKQIGFSLDRKLSVAESQAGFSSSASLYLAPQHCINTAGIRLRFFERLANATYRPVDPPQVKFELHEQPQHPH